MNAEAHSERLRLIKNYTPRWCFNFNLLIKEINNWIKIWKSTLKTLSVSRSSSLSFIAFYCQSREREREREKEKREREKCRDYWSLSWSLLSLLLLLLCINYTHTHRTYTCTCIYRSSWYTEWSTNSSRAPHNMYDLDCARCIHKCGFPHRFLTYLFIYLFLYLFEKERSTFSERAPFDEIIVYTADNK